jgi:ankyrin repeat protein
MQANNNNLYRVQNMLSLPTIEKILANLPLLFIHPHARYQDGGKTTLFEQREPGCTAAFLKGFALAIQKPNEPLSIELIQKIHQAMMSGVKKVGSTVSPGNFRSREVRFGIMDEHITQKGLQQLISQCKKQFPGDVSPRLIVEWSSTYREMDLISEFFGDSESPESPEGGYSNIFLNSGLLNYQAPFPTSDPEQISTEVGKILDDFNTAMSGISDPDDSEPDDKGRIGRIVMAIAKCIQKLELLHPFQDGNIRTFVNGVLNKLLIEHNLPPAILYDPNCVDGQSKEEFYIEILEAMLATCHLATAATDKLYGVTIEAKAEYDENEENFLQSLRNSLSGIEFASDAEIEALKQDLLILLNQCYKSKPEDSEQVTALETESNMELLRSIAFGVDVALPENSEQVAALEGRKGQPPLFRREGRPPLYRGRNALHVALLCGNIPVVKKILSEYPELKNVPDMWGNYPLSYALHTKNFELIRDLVPSNNIKVPKDQLKEIVLQSAKYLSKKEFVEFRRIIEGRSQAIHLSEYDLIENAVQWGNIEIVKFLLNSDNKDDAAMAAVEFFQKETLNFILDKYPSSKETWARAIQKAMLVGDEQLALDLLQRCESNSNNTATHVVNCNLSESEWTTEKLIHEAVRCGCIKVAEKIVQIVDKNDLSSQKTYEGKNLLHLAVDSGDIEDIEVVKWVCKTFPQLLEHKDSDNNTPLANAVVDGKVNYAKWLLSKCANPNVLLNSCETLLFIALIHDDLELFECLLNHDAYPSAAEKVNATQSRSQTSHFFPGFDSDGELGVNHETKLEELLREKGLWETYKERISANKANAENSEVPAARP